MNQEILIKHGYNITQNNNNTYTVKNQFNEVIYNNVPLNAHELFVRGFLFGLRSAKDKPPRVVNQLEELIDKADALVTAKESDLEQAKILQDTIENYGNQLSQFEMDLEELE